jgi:outer membrane cobalamin receptor
MSRIEQGNPNLSVETSQQLELSMTRKLHKNWSMEANLYHHCITDFIQLEPSMQPAEVPIYRTIQTDAQVSGLEWNVAWFATPSMGVNLAASAIRAVEANGSALPLIPPANARLEWNWLKHDRSGKKWKTLIIGRVSPEASLLDAALSLTWNRYLKSTVSISNLMDHSYQTVLSQLNNLGLPEPGRNIKLRLEWNF